MYRKPIGTLVAVALYLGMASLCPGAIEPVTSVTCDKPDGAIPYNLLSITVGRYTVGVDDLRVGTTTTTMNLNAGDPWPEMDSFDIHEAINTGLATTATTQGFGGQDWKDTNGNNPDFFLFESNSGDSTGDNPEVAAILPGGIVGQSITLSGTSFGPTGYFRVADAADGMGMAGQQILGISFAVTDLLDDKGNALTNESVIAGIALTDRGGADITGFYASAGPLVRYVKAFDPKPADGTIGVTTPLFQWTAGDTAFLHEVYIGADSELGPGDLAMPRTPMTIYWHVPGLEPGATYFWRVDEIEADGVTTHTGDVWSFMTQALTAYCPNPEDDATDVSPTPTLNWMPGEAAVQHYVYFGDSFDAVSQGAAATDKGTLEHDNTSFSPDELASLETYYWRVDEIAVGNEVRPGDVWSFTTYRPIDDFESYTDDEGSRIYEAWIDGWVNNTGSTVGYVEAPFAEQTIVRGGLQSMPLDYNNVNSPWLSEAELEFTPPQDWSINGADTLILHVRGQFSNDPAPMYVALRDASNQTASVTHPDADIVKASAWTEWRIPLSDFAGVDIAAVEGITIGLGDAANPSPGGAGLIYIDDICLSRSEPPAAAE